MRSPITLGGTYGALRGRLYWRRRSYADDTLPPWSADSWWSYRTEVLAPLGLWRLQTGRRCRRECTRSHLRSRACGVGRGLQRRRWRGSEG